MKEFFHDHVASIAGIVILAGLLLITGTLLVISQQGRQRRHDICTEVQKVKLILYNEHKQSLARTERFLRKHPNGVDGISRKDLANAIVDQLVLIQQLKPDNCAD